MKTTPIQHPSTRGRARLHSASGLRHPAFRRAFTLTEVLISLAMVSVLLIGISRIFALTSQTIGTGQALSKAVRGHKAIQQTMAGDIIGIGADINAPDMQNGMYPLTNAGNSNDAAPFMTISNFRTPAYLNEAAFKSDIDAPDESRTTIATRSRPTRTFDANGNGAIDNPASSVSQGGETYSLYDYGVRNFRSDTFSFFARGRFASQTATNVNSAVDVDFQSGAQTSDAWIWYGHLRVFNSDIANIDRESTYGSPGDWRTPVRDYVGAAPGTAAPNVNNRFAEDFTLGRVTLLMKDVTDHDGDSGTSSTVVANDDPGKAVVFISRNWNEPYDFSSNRQVTPFNLASTARRYVTPGSPATGAADFTRDNKVVDLQDNVPAVGSGPFLTLRDGRSDMGCAGIATMRERVRAVQEYDADPAGALGKFPSNTQITYVGGSHPWWRYIPAGWNQRFNVNPFPPTAGDGLSRKGLAQRQQILGVGVPQFIVEYAGDFIRQNPETGEVDSNADAMRPDGVTDFVVVNGYRQTRWYGLPRDVNGDGIVIGTSQTATIVTRPIEVIGGAYYRDPSQILAQLQRPTGANALAILSSPDVIPLRDVAGYFRPFEKAAPLPPPTGFYDRVIDEPTGVANRTIDSANPSPEMTGYICIWGAQEMDTPVAGKTPTTPANFSQARDVEVYAVPQLVRVIVAIIDEQGKLKEPVTQEFVFPVRGK